MEFIVIHVTNAAWQMKSLPVSFPCAGFGCLSSEFVEDYNQARVQKRAVTTRSNIKAQKSELSLRCLTISVT